MTARSHRSDRGSTEYEASSPMTDPARPFTLLDRETSWLHFGARVLQEAADPTVPLLERLFFCGIFSSNLDEYFRVRVASLRSLIRDDDGGAEGIEVTNALRYLNHSSRPNAEIDGLELYALRNIQPGAEILIHYGNDWNDVE